MGTFLATPLLAVQIITSMRGTFIREAPEPRLARNASAPCEGLPNLGESNSSAATARSNAHRIAKR
jgi:hypothetical protein